MPWITTIPRALSVVTIAASIPLSREPKADQKIDGGKDTGDNGSDGRIAQAADDPDGRSLDEWSDDSERGEQSPSICYL